MLAFYSKHDVSEAFRLIWLAIVGSEDRCPPSPHQARDSLKSRANLRADPGTVDP